jgi:hypothetical protein
VRPKEDAVRDARLIVGLFVTAAATGLAGGRGLVRATASADATERAGAASRASDRGTSAARVVPVAPAAAVPPVELAEAGDAVHREPPPVAARLRDALGEAPSSDQVAAADAAASRIRAEARRLDGAADHLAAERVARADERALEFIDGHRLSAPAHLLVALEHARGVHPFALVVPRERFARFFERRVRGPRVDGPRRRPADPLPEGATLAYPAGEFSWRAGGRGLPGELVVEGAGALSTTLRIEEIAGRDEAISITFRDLTIDCGGGTLACCLDGPAMLRFERCRVTGLDPDGAAPVVLALRRGALWAEDTVFDAGACRGPATLVRATGALLARLDRCEFRGRWRQIWVDSDAATMVLSGCRFAELDAMQREEMRAPPLGVRFNAGGGASERP